ncbi:predicted protein [Histoplasma capsulatum var. duboisii H88]|uniref:Predicted protein n=1 Tax=Ajellomyces capsulatus (strain H88) TaxID=544711 RepID=F0UHX7_AJEC8|nr:predicted protein [Histoplasma capsulatum var. duboisii H88]
MTDVRNLLKHMRQREFLCVRQMLEQRQIAQRSAHWQILESLSRCSMGIMRGRGLLSRSRKLARWASGWISSVSALAKNYPLSREFPKQLHPHQVEIDHA